jgi:prepilin-type N-terminal cleavage/methylation domain-containing protein/prepilin-type processing-associated H-X9-DG protein
MRYHLRGDRRAFTLIELLVVVAIIALLVAILLPSLGKAKKRANITRCLANIRGVVGVLNVYMTDHQCQLPYDFTGANDYWTLALTEAGNSNKLDICPETVLNPAPTGGPVVNPPNPTVAWTVISSVNTQLNTSGSYSINSWLQQPAPPGQTDWGLTLTPVPTPVPTKAYYWKYPYDGGPDSQIPMLGDAYWPDAWPCESDFPPTDLTTSPGSTNGNMMRRFCLDRHNKTVNMGFADGHAENLQLQTLWTLKWHKNYIANKIPVGTRIPPK